MKQIALILGASGRFGRNACIAFENAGWTVRRFNRSTDDLARAAWGADVIVNGWNPRYSDWERQLPGLTERVIRVAKQSGATVIIPGNVYVFGRDAPELWSENTPHDASNPLGQVRIAMERAYAASGVPTIILRAGDFIDTEASGNWFDMMMIKSLKRGVFTYPGDPKVPHAWAFLPDVARATVELAERRQQLPSFTDIPFPGYTMSGEQMGMAINRLTTQDIRLKRMSWLPMQLARPFWSMAGKLVEMRYLWFKPHALDGSQFRSLLPDFRETPIETALASAVPNSLINRQINPNQTVTAGG